MVFVLIHFAHLLLLMQLSLISRLKHEYFVELLGYCLEANNRILIYEFATNGSLHDILHGKLSVILIAWYRVRKKTNDYVFDCREERSTRRESWPYFELESKSENCLWCCKRPWISSWKSTTTDRPSGYSIKQCSFIRRFLVENIWL